MLREGKFPVKVPLREDKTGAHVIGPRPGILWRIREEGPGVRSLSGEDPGPLHLNHVYVWRRPLGQFQAYRKRVH